LKAELFSSDFMIGLSVFLIAMSIFGIYYTNLQNDVVDYKIRNDMQTKANSIADQLATSSGSPEFWNSSNVNVIGLEDSNLINLTKFQELKNIDYYVAKTKLGVGGYELYIEIKNQTGNVISDGEYMFGMETTDDTENIFYVSRYALANISGKVSKVILGVAVWS
jgi:hypothetical protein